MKLRDWLGSTAELPRLAKLNLARHANLLADLEAVKGAARRNERRAQQRLDTVDDALASGQAGATINTAPPSGTSEDDGVNTSIDSPSTTTTNTTTNNYAASNSWTNAVIASLAILAAIGWYAANQQGTVPITPPVTPTPSGPVTPGHVTVVNGLPTVTPPTQGNKQ